jgi:hypothetical protein
MRLQLSLGYDRRLTVRLPPAWILLLGLQRGLLIIIKCYVCLDLLSVSALHTLRVLGHHYLSFSHGRDQWLAGHEVLAGVGRLNGLLHDLGCTSGLEDYVIK